MKIAVPNVLRGDCYKHHAQLLCDSYQRWTGRTLVTPPQDEHLAECLFRAPFALISSGVEEDPLFNFGNATVLRLFEVGWDELTQMPARESAEPEHRGERDRLMDRVSEEGWISDYRGVRISATGRRFLIKNATVWKLIDSGGEYRGKAAMFERWTYL